MKTEKTHPAMLWGKLPDGKVQCKLCPWQCVIAESKTGICRVRRNVGGELVSLNYHQLCAANDDPIEKKPLFHFQPESLSFSVACVGCNFRCEFCQNWQISQMARAEGRIVGEGMEPASIVDHARHSGCQSISYTYTEPTIFFELAYDTSKLAHEAGLKNVFVSNGYISIEALKMISPYLDAINVDLKSFREEFYHRVCHGRLEPVKDSLRWLAKSGIWVEVTTLLVPGQNDSDEEMNDIAKFIAEQMGPQVPWHVSRFHPDYQLTGIPATPMSTVEKALQFGREAGLRYCYGGNVMGHQSENTYCYHCERPLIERRGFVINKNDIVDGKCPQCGTVIDGVELDWQGRK
ncbi:MAG: AmmeMemoRadiSam system radical SAM enzyme [Phycisphaerae bacterium]